MSTASTGASLELASSIALAMPPRGAPAAPVPSRASTITAARASERALAAQASSSSQQRSRRGTSGRRASAAAASPAYSERAAVQSTSTASPAAASRRAATKPSPALLPLPASTTTAPPCASSSATRATAVPALSISSVPGMPARSPQAPLPRALLDSDGLGEVAGLVDVVAAASGDLVGEQLQRHHREQRLQQRVDRRQGNQLVGVLAHALVALRADRDHARSARAHLLHVGDQLAKHRRVRRHADHRRRLVKQRNRAMLHLARGVCVGCDVGDLLELQRALQRDRQPDIAPDVEEELLLPVALGDRRHRAAQIAVASVIG